MEEDRIDQRDDVFSSFFGSSYDSSSFQAAPTSKISDHYSYASSSPSSSSNDESEPSNPLIDDTNKRIDYMIQFLDRRISSSGPQPHDMSSSLPEFVGKGGGTGIFRVPIRAAVHPTRPPSLEVRRHPLRESQSGRFLRTMISTANQLWAGSEDGVVRVWELRDIYGHGTGVEEADTAPYRESVDVGSAVMCMVGDEGSGVIWTGHRDGGIRCWKMRADRKFGEVFSWQAHTGPVLAVVTSAYGE